MKGLLSLLLLYLAFTSGLVFEFTQSNGDSMDIPFSYALSAERTGLTGVYSEDDLICARWIAEKSDQSKMITADQNGYALLLDYMHCYPRQLFPGTLRYIDLYNLPPNVYVFMTTWNTVNQKTVLATNVGTRTVKHMPNLCSCYAKVVFKSGLSTVYFTGNINENKTD
jgi:uncharacterized membrane protein